MGAKAVSYTHLDVYKRQVFNGRINVAHPDMDPSGELTLSTMGLQPYYNTTERMKRGFCLLYTSSVNTVVIGVRMKLE